MSPNAPRASPAARFLAEVARPANHLRCIERIAALPAWRLAGMQESLEATAGADTDLSAILNDAPGIARALAREVATDRWRPLPARLRLATLDKPRLLHKFDPLDLIVHGVVAAALTELLAGRLSAQVHSYQRGKSGLLALRAFAKFLRTHARERPDPRSRGLFVLRRDVKSFGDSVQLGAAAPLWAQLRALFEPGDPAEIARAMALCEQVIRPVVLGSFEEENSGEAQRLQGLPTGSPVNPVCTNLHLIPLDDALAEIPGGFYARYGDDLLFAHPDPAVARDASERIDASLSLLKLRAHGEKRLDLWLNGAGRPSPEAGFVSARETGFLGKSISFAGNLRLPEEKLALLFEELEKRLSRTARLAREAGALEEDELRLLCTVAAEALAADAPFALPGANDLRDQVDDRGQLRAVELRLARLIVRAATGARSVRALREFPPARLRALGLPGLVAARSAPRQPAVSRWET